MTDLDMIRLAAEAMGITTLPDWTDCESRHVKCKSRCQDKSRCEPGSGESDSIHGQHFDPLHDDAQAMALVKKLRLSINSHNADYQVWPTIGKPNDCGRACSFNADLNRAIVEVCARMWAQRDK